MENHSDSRVVPNSSSLPKVVSGGEFYPIFSDEDLLELRNLGFNLKSADLRNSGYVHNAYLEIQNVQNILENPESYLHDLREIIDLSDPDDLLLFSNTPINAVINDNFSLSIFSPQAYLDFLAFTGNDPEEARVQAIRYALHSCSSGNHWLYYPDVICGPLNAWHDNKKIRGSSWRTAKKIFKTKASNVMFWDLTFPKPFSNLSYIDPKTAEKVAWKVLDKFVALLQQDLHGSVGIYANYHPHKTSVPVAPHSHFHLVVLDHIKIKCRRTKKGKISQLEQLPQRRVERLKNSGKLKKFLKSGCPQERGKDPGLCPLLCDGFQCDKDHNLYYRPCNFPVFSKEKLQGLWFEAMSSIIPKFLLVSAEGSPLTDEKVDVYMSYSPITAENRGRITHRVKYQKRTPKSDLLNYYYRFDFDPAGVSKTFGSYIVQYGNKSRTYGFWRRLANFSDNGPDPQASCPVCGSPMSYVYTFDELTPPIDLIFISRHKMYLFRGHGKDPPPDEKSILYLQEKENPFGNVEIPQRPYPERDLFSQKREIAFKILASLERGIQRYEDLIEEIKSPLLDQVLEELRAQGHLYSPQDRVYLTV